MARFSLSPPAKPQPLSPQSPNFQWKFPPPDYPPRNCNDFNLYQDYDNDETSDDSSSSCSSQDDSSYNESSEEEEPPHPLGFNLYGRTRFGLSPSSYTIPVPIDEAAWNAPVHISNQYDSYPRHHHGIPSSTLLNGITQYKSQDGDMDRISNLLKAATLHDIPPPINTPNAKLLQLASLAQHELNSINTQMTQLQSSHEASHQSAVQALMLLLEADANAVSAAKSRMDRRQATKLAHEQQVLLQLRKEEEQELLAQEELRKAEEVKNKQLEEEKLAKEERIRQQAAEERLAREELDRLHKEKYAYVQNAKELVSKLHSLRSTLQQFDKDKSVSRRRLAFKKIVNGKINTLSHDEDKIKQVASLVVSTINTAQADDEASEGVGKMGKLYMMDLLCSNLIVRVQADGFNGTRGDGFPLGCAFALISNECEDIKEILEGHLFGVCPMGVPVLEMDKDGTGDGVDGTSEEERWMESLGMVREKSGEFESFDKFLHRTEGLISIMANIMSSLPSTHTLLGGHEGALTWLQRFLDLLPDPPSKPLPLTTAPVLVAFITGAGHMLANKFSSQFQPLFACIENDIMDRLDDSPVGVPSATRLRKVMEGGFDGFKKNMPAGAVESLYDGREGSGTAETSLPPVGSSVKVNPFGQGASGASPFGQGTSGSTPFGQTSSSNATPFGQTSASNATPFGQTSTTNATPFGQTSSTTNATPFGQTSTSNATPFGQAASNTSPFGVSTGTANAPSFGTNSMMESEDGNTGGAGGNSNPFSTSSWGSSFGGSAASPFALSAQAPAPSSGAFGGQTNTFQSQSNPFGGGGTATAAPSPFGSQPTSSPFGTATSNPFGGNAAPAPSPFGAFSNQPQSNNPFGGTSTTQGNGPFNSAASSSFGSSNSGNIKKDTRPPCKFFAKGNCRYGANCKFSHDGAPSAGNSGGSFSSFGSSFGASGGGFSNPSPFGGGGSAGFGNATPFSSNASSNPFGGPRG